MRRRADAGRVFAETTMKTRKLPDTDSIKALARFWDTHDLTDYGDPLEEVVEPVFVRETPIQLSLGTNEAKAVTELAQAKGISREELIREWVFQKLAPKRGNGSKKH
jgi:hypothetical protein